MACFSGPEIVTNGLVMYVDAANIKSTSVNPNFIYDISNYSGNTRRLALSGTTNPTLENTYISFDGIDQFAAIYNDSYTWTADSEITIEILFRAKSFPSLQYTGGTIFGHAFGNNLLILLQPSVTTSTKINVAYDDSRYDTNHDTTNSIELNEWIHFVFLGIPNGQVTGDLKYYINGILDKAQFTSSDTSGPGSTVSWLIARSGRGYAGDGTGDAGTNYLYGDIDISFVRIYGRNLSEIEIKQNFEATRTRYGI